jgi:hypothetical protein
VPALRYFDSAQQDRDLLDYFYVEALESRDFSGVIRQQADTAQVQVREDLRAHSDFTLRLALAFRQGGKTLVAMEGENWAVADFFYRESFRGLVEINQRTAAFLGDSLQ